MKRFNRRYLKESYSNTVKPQDVTYFLFLGYPSIDGSSTSVNPIDYNYETQSYDELDNLGTDINFLKNAIKNDIEECSREFFENYFGTIGSDDPDPEVDFNIEQISDNKFRIKFTGQAFGSQEPDDYDDGEDRYNDWVDYQQSRWEDYCESYRKSHLSNRLRESWDDYLARELDKHNGAGKSMEYFTYTFESEFEIEYIGCEIPPEVQFAELYYNILSSEASYDEDSEIENF